MRSTAPPAAVLSAFLLAAAAPAALIAPERAIVADVDAHADADVALLQRLVEVNSGTRNQAGVVRVAEMVAAQLRPLGFAARWVAMPQTGRAGHLVADHPGDGRGRRILLIGHVDTVFEADSPFRHFERHGAIASGPGVNDMKGGLVVMLAALRAMRAAGTLDRADVRIVLSGDEESAGRPVALARADMIAAGRWADAALEFETGAQQDGADIGSIARRGSVSWKLTASARTGHSSGVMGAGGFGANYELVRILDAFRRDLREPDLTYNVGLILGGVQAVPATPEAIAGTASGKPNIIAAQALATGDIRALSNDQAARVQDRMRAIVARHLPGTDAAIAFDEGYPAMPPTAGSRALLAALNGVNRDLGLAPMAELDPMKRGAGDIAFVAPYVDGLVGTGAMGEGAHSERETVELASIPRQAKRAAILMTRLSQLPPIKPR